MLWYEHDNPMDAPTVLADAPLGVIVGWSYDEYNNENRREVSSPHLPGGFFHLPAEDDVVVATWAEAMGLTAVPHPDDGDIVIAWVAPENWEMAPNLSQRFFLSAGELMRSGMNFPRWLVQQGHIVHETGVTDDEQEYTEEQVEEARLLIEAFDAAINSAEGLNRGAADRLRDAQQNAESQRERVNSLQQDHAAAIQSQHEYESQADEARQALAGLDVRAILNRFDAVESIAAMTPIESAEVDAEGNFRIKTYPYRMRGNVIDSACTDHQRAGNILAVDGCDDCNRDGERTVMINPLHITLDPNRGRVRFSERDRHPHLSSGDACWGAAGTAINDAVARQDYETLMHMILGWVTQYNPGSPYRRIEMFDTVRGEPGWVLPDAE
jgi:hypothetical protein